MARLGYPVVGLLAVEGQGAAIELEADGFGFAGSEFDALEAFQLLGRAVDAGVWIGDVELDDLGACTPG